MSTASALVLIAAPGAGKTTRVPPALLDGGLAVLPGGTAGQVIVLQPRRVAARAAACRISEERGTKVGAEIGYQVRHESRVSASTRIVVCTEGVFLRRLQADPLLENVACVVFDEFHERSLDSDLALALTKQVQKELRPELKLLVMSATLEAEPVKRYLSDCPVLTCPGRTYPVSIEYMPMPAKSTIEQAVAAGVKKVLAIGSGHILAFLPGVGEIRKTEDLLGDIAEKEDLTLLPLYGTMSLDEQQAVLAKSGRRKVILATNVAETSLTIDGVTAVVDSGMARINRLEPRLGLNRLGLERISKASAQQRAGRAGRTAGGVCLRLWSEREHQALSPFSSPEIERVELSQSILQLLAWGESDLAAFDWFEPPPPAALSQALALLDSLDAMQGGTLTELGRKMAKLPLPPRLSRMLLEGLKLGQIKDISLCAAMLADRDPIKISRDDSGARHKSQSDVLDRVWALSEFVSRGHKHSVVGELLVGPAKQILRTADELGKMLREHEEMGSGPACRNLPPGGTSVSEPTTGGLPGGELPGSGPPVRTVPAGELPGSGPLVSAVGAGLVAKKNEGLDGDEAIMRALLAAFGDRVCRRREPGGKSALMVGGRGVKLSPESAVSDAELFVAVELLETGQSDALVKQASAIKKEWLSPTHIKSGTDVFYDSSRQKVVAFKRTRFCDLVIEEAIGALPDNVDAGETLARGLADAKFDLAMLVDDESKQFLARIECLKRNLPELVLPEFSTEPWHDLLSQWCMGLSSVAELKSRSFLTVLQASLSYEQLSMIDRETPERIDVPSGNRIKLSYEPGKPPVLAVRIQEIFGMTETPKVAMGRQPVLLHLLAPNYRVQQITPDLVSFWKNTYSEVKKDLKARYPKHSWPDNPLIAQAERGPKRRK